MRRLIIILKNIIMVPYKIIHHISIFTVLQESQIDKKAAICTGTKFYRSKIGKYSYVGNNSFISDTTIGNFCSISTDCYIGGASHPTDWVSTSSVFHKWKNIMKKNFSKHEYNIFAPTNIGNDVWIGRGVTIKAGINIENGAIIGMGSVVTKDVGPYEIWAGNPAKLIKKRFDEETINFLLKNQWWNFEDEEIEKYAKFFNNIDEYMKVAGK